MFRQIRSYKDSLKRINNLVVEVTNDSACYKKCRDDYYNCLKFHELCDSDFEYRNECREKLKLIQMRLEKLRPDDYYQHHSI